jgi:hypothetical protein
MDGWIETSKKENTVEVTIFTIFPGFVLNLELVWGSRRTVLGACVCLSFVP